MWSTVFDNLYSLRQDNRDLVNVLFILVIATYVCWNKSVTKFSPLSTSVSERTRISASFGLRDGSGEPLGDDICKSKVLLYRTKITNEHPLDPQAYQKFV